MSVAFGQGHDDPYRLEWYEGITMTEMTEERLVGVLNDAALALMLSIGHRTGLLDALAAGTSTVDELAERAGCARRYVREWLGAMVAADVAVLDADRYRLADGAADLLTRSGEANLAVFMQYVAVLGSVEDEIVECFRTGGGLGYEHFPRFHEVMAEDSAQTVLAALDAHVLPMVPGLVERLEEGIDVLDVGCGSGRVLRALADRFPHSRFVGIDLSESALAAARQTADGLENLEFRQVDAARVDEVFDAGAFGLVTTFDAIHDQADPRQVLRGIRHLVAPAGHYLAQDIAGSGTHAGDRDHPLGPFLYTISTMHCMTVSLAVGGAGWGTMWGTPMAGRELAAAGFADVRVHRLEHDPQNAWYVCAA